MIINSCKTYRLRFLVSYTLIPIDQAEQEEHGQVQAAINLLMKNVNTFCLLVI